MGALLLLVPLVLGYTRIARDATIASPVRRALLEALARADALTATELGRLAGVSRKTTAYHLQMLARAGLVARRGAGRALWAVAGHGRDAMAARALRHPRRRAVWEVAKARPGATITELSRAVAMKPGTVWFHVRVLERNALLVCERGGFRAVERAPA
jgi:predicted transcriptional regulator